MFEDINQTPAASPNLKTELAKKLEELAPEVIADGKVDVTKLKELLDGDAASESERFGLFWPGKLNAIRTAQTPTTATLKPAPELSKDWDTTGNVFIEGDNLEALKILQKHYHGKIKMIYIDPPYNTGKDFVYPDNYKEGLQTYLEWTKQVSEDGRKLSSNSESDGRYHSHWLNMMYPRLKLARSLLSPEGLLFISIDDTEIHSLKRICDEIFGEGNYVAAAPRKTGAGSAATRSEAALRKLNDYVLIYTRSPEATLRRKLVGKKEYPYADRWGNYRLGQFQASGSDATRAARPNMWYPIYLTHSGNLTTNEPSTYQTAILPHDVNAEQGRWLWTRAKFEADKDRLIYFDGKTISRKIYFDPDADQNVYQVEKAWIEGYTNAAGTKEVDEIFNTKKIFDHPKPTDLIKHLIQLYPGKDGVVLDFFSGSATTAHAVMQLNAEDDGNRRHIQVQLPEPVDSASAAGKAGFKTIADIARKRIDLAGEKIKQDYAEQLSKRETPLDVGYRTYKLTDTNFAKWRETSDTDATTLEQHLFDLRENADDDADQLSLLIEILLKQGYSLTEKVEPVQIGGLEVLSVAGGLALAYVNEQVKPTLAQLRALVDRDPERLIILEDAFQGDDQLKTNLVQLAKTNDVKLWTA